MIYEHLTLEEAQELTVFLGQLKTFIVDWSTLSTKEYYTFPNFGGTIDALFAVAPEFEKALQEIRSNKNGKRSEIE